MTTIHVDTRTFSIRLPALVLGRLGTSIVLQFTEQVELRIERRTTRARRTRHTRHTQHAVVRAEADAQRTLALAQRLGTL